MGNAIYTHRWNPSPEQARDAPGIYLLHGTGEHAGRYQRLADRLALAGWRVGAHDHPGHGQSEGKRGLIDPPGALATQAALQIKEFACETGESPVLFGHSLGGVLASELVLEHNLQVAGLVLSAPAFVPHISKLDRVKLKLLTVAAPSLCLDLGYNARNLTHDDDEQRIASHDALNHGFKSATLVNWLMQSGSRSLHHAHELAVDTLLLIAGADPVVDSSQTRLFGHRVSADRMTVHEYDGYYHEILNETPAWRERVESDITQWLTRFDH